MEIIAALVAALSPFIIAGLTEHIKKLRAIQLTEYRKTVLRTIVAVLSAVLAVATALLTDQPLDEKALATGVQATLSFIGATGMYFLAKYRQAQEEGRVAN